MAARIELLTPIVTAMMGNTRERKVVEGFQRELQSITEDLQAARLQGRLNQFFNSADHSSSLEKHNATLAQLIADSTLVTVNEVLQYIHELEYHVSDTIRDCLEDYGFETVAAVLDASDLILKEDGLKPGQLLELRRAQRSGESGESRRFSRFYMNAVPHHQG
ncbi:hypothetical protein C8F04DRAFT_1236718 [Mycena alexandri]|uniref:Uncharacterized protein n=1 Tax=Mycena alexandri TaxID=1745969 RepID=A0AAD6WYQ4_9AGAR|nr:hypothetical protein C8F04DRAFT_1236718 [Mycena alexandri]